MYSDIYDEFFEVLSLHDVDVYVPYTVEVRETESWEGAFSCNAVGVCESNVYSGIQG